MREKQLSIRSSQFQTFSEIYFLLLGISSRRNSVDRSRNVEELPASISHARGQFREKINVTTETLQPVLNRSTGTSDLSDLLQPRWSDANCRRVAIVQNIV